MMIAATFPRAALGQAGMAMSAMAPPGRTFAVRLIDRRTGRTHRINGYPLIVYARHPDEAAADLLDGRDPAVWEARIEALTPGGAA